MYLNSHVPHSKMPMHGQLPWRVHDTSHAFVQNATIACVNPIRCHFHFRTTPVSFEHHEQFPQYCLLPPAAVKQTQVPSQASFHNGHSIRFGMSCIQVHTCAMLFSEIIL